MHRLSLLPGLLIALQLSVVDAAPEDYFERVLIRDGE